MENLHDKRKIYSKGELLEDCLPKDPFGLFKTWYQQAEACPEIAEANAMSVSSVSEEGIPSTRIVLLKEFEDNQFVFYSNYQSHKSSELAMNPLACLHFFWPALERQIIIKADITRTSPERSKAYFESRPRGSQLGAWASPQSRAIASREVLAQNLQDLEAQYRDQAIPYPSHWGGFIATAFEIEFWQGRPNRLHDRILYRQDRDKGWEFKRLAP
jgi:pyridoxamine 5'-phosphate oxidase